MAREITHMLQTQFQLNYGFEFGNRCIMQLFELLCMSLVCLDKYPVGCIKDTIHTFLLHQALRLRLHALDQKIEINIPRVHDGYERL